MRTGMRSGQLTATALGYRVIGNESSNRFATPVLLVINLLLAKVWGSESSMDPCPMFDNMQSRVRRSPSELDGPKTAA